MEYDSKKKCNKGKQSYQKRGHMDKEMTYWCDFNWCIGLILISNNENLQTSVFHKKTYTALLLNYFSFVPDSYKYGLIKALIDRMYRINSTWTSFDIFLKNLKQVLHKNQYPLTMIDNVIKKYLQNAVNKTNTGSMPVEMPNIETRYFKLPFIGMYSKVTQNKIEKPCKTFCKSQS